MTGGNFTGSRKGTHPPHPAAQKCVCMCVYVCACAVLCICRMFGNLSSKHVMCSKHLALTAQRRVNACFGRKPRRHPRRATRGANGGRGVAVGEEDTVGREGVDVGCCDSRRQVVSVCVDVSNTPAAHTCRKRVWFIHELTCM